jgi:hypothetical protein
MRTRKRQGTEPGRDEELEQEEMKNRTRKRWGTRTRKRRGTGRDEAQDQEEMRNVSDEKQDQEEMKSVDPWLDWTANINIMMNEWLIMMNVLKWWKMTIKLQV